MFKLDKKFLLLGGVLGVGCGSILLILAIAGGMMFSQEKAPGGTNTYTPTPTPSPSLEDKKLEIVRIARDQLGKPYIWGSSGPNGFDCSGLVLYAYKESNCRSDLPHNAHTLYLMSDKISKDELQPGDLVFANWGKRWDGIIGWRHVGIYAGDNKVIHASISRGGVVEDNISAWWKGYGRIECN